MRCFLIIFLFIAASSCDQPATGDAEKKDTGKEMTTSVPSTVYPFSFEGNCAGCRSFDTLKDYADYLVVLKNDSGYLNIRSDASDFSSGPGKNKIGKIPCGTGVWGYGPLKNADGSAGIAYAIALRDRSGNICRGYVSATGVKHIYHRK